MRLRRLPNARKSRKNEPVVPYKPTAELTAATLLHRLQPFGAEAHLALAVSGGGDSMGLLALAAQAQTYDHAPRFSVLSVDHKLRAEAAAEVTQVAQICRDLGLPHEVLTADKSLPEHDIQQQARKLRYRLMAAWCAQHNAQAVVLAHHRDDQAETVLMRMARGSGVQGLGGMAPRQKIHTDAGPLILLRPFLSDTGASLKQLAIEAGLPIIHDPSNDDPSFERVRWRRLLPRLEAEGLDAARLADIADTMRGAQAALDTKLTGWLDAHAAWHDYGVLCLPRAGFEALPRAHQQRLLGRFVQYFGHHPHPLKRKKTAHMLAQIAARPHGAAVLGGVHVRWRQETIFMGRETAACPTPLPLNAVKGVWDRRFALPDNCADSLHVAALGQAGVQELRDGGAVFDAQIPAAYFAALPGIFAGEKLQACPIIEKNNDNLTDFGFSSVYREGFYRDILGEG